jgi:hypothetical protein
LGIKTSYQKLEIANTQFINGGEVLIGREFIRKANFRKLKPPPAYGIVLPIDRQQATFLQKRF